MENCILCHSIFFLLYFRVIRVTQEPQISNYTTTQINNKPKVVIRPAIAPKAEDNRVQYVRVVSSQPMAQVSIVLCTNRCTVAPSENEL